MISKNKFIDIELRASELEILRSSRLYCVLGAVTANTSDMFGGTSCLHSFLMSFPVALSFLCYLCTAISEYCVRYA